MTPLQFSIELNIDSANFKFPFSTRCTLSEKKRSVLSEPFAKDQQLLKPMYIKNDLDGTFCFLNLVDLFNKHPINRTAGITREYTTNGNID